MSPKSPTIWDGEIDSEETKQQLARSLMHAPFEDEEGRRLYAKFGRVQLFGNDEQRKKLNVMLRDVGKQIILIVERREYQHARDYTGEGTPRWFKPDVWRGIFSSVILGLESIPSPQDATNTVVLLRSSKEMTRRQYAACIDLVQHFGDSHLIDWTPPKENKPEPAEPAKPTEQDQ